MKKFLVSLTFVMFFSALSFAELTLDVKLYNFSGTYSGDTEVNRIDWSFSPSDITYGSSEPQWKVSNVYAVIKAVYTESSSTRVYIYTDNKNNSESKYKVQTGRVEDAGTMYSGLVRANSNGGSYGYAPLKYMCIKKGASNVPTSLSGFDFSGDDVYGSRWMKDISDTDMNSKVTHYDPAISGVLTQKDFYTKIISEYGTWIGYANYYASDYKWSHYGAWWSGNNADAYNVATDVYVFFEACFKDVVSNDTFSTEIKFVCEVDN